MRGRILEEDRRQKTEEDARVRSSGVQEFRSRQENPECEEEHVIG
jgi:hypothetical protein